ncbi:MAG: hypothetical protein FJ087_17270 [Deltaproteobacteria bacterium]|nr:hypothetical protein [Deltaproteobacteria bacterium]
MTDPGGLEPERSEFKQSAGDFKAVDGAGVLAIPVAAPKAGKAVLKASADFSVCDEKTCHVFRGVAVEVPVDVQ